MVESTVTSRGRTTLPKAVREALGIVRGDRLRYIVSDDNRVRMLPVHPPRGCLEPSSMRVRRQRFRIWSAGLPMGAPRLIALPAGAFRRSRGLGRRVEEQQRADLDALARRRAGRRGRIEGTVRGPARGAVGQ